MKNALSCPPSPPNYFASVHSDIYICSYISYPIKTMLTNPTHPKPNRQRSSTSNPCSSFSSSSSAHPHMCTHYFRAPWTGIRMGKCKFLPLSDLFLSFLNLPGPSAKIPPSSFHESLFNEQKQQTNLLVPTPAASSVYSGNSRG